MDQDPSTRFSDVETYEPQSVSWGLYARPKNVPQAFGSMGGAIPEGGVTLDGDKEWLQKYEELMVCAFGGVGGWVGVGVGRRPRVHNATHM